MNPFRQRRLLVRRSLLILGLISIFLIEYAWFVQAQSFYGPTMPAPDNGDLNNSDLFGSYLRKNPSPLAPQFMSGPLVIASSTDAGYSGGWARVGDAEVSARVVGVSGSAQPPSVSSFGVGPVGVYGYARGKTENYGIYGKVAGATSVALAGMTTNPDGYAATIYGQAKLDVISMTSGTLTVANRVSAPLFSFSYNSADKTQILGKQGIKIDAPLGVGAEGRANYYGIYGQSTNGMGIVAVNDSGSGTGADTKIAVKGEMTAVTGYGVLGSSRNGNGVAGEIGSSSSQAVVKGVSTGSSMYASSVGVYGESASWAAIFDGELKVASNASLAIGSSAYKLSRSNILAILQWCLAQTNTKCVQDYCASGSYPNCN